MGILLRSLLGVWGLVEQVFSCPLSKGMIASAVPVQHAAKLLKGLRFAAQVVERYLVSFAAAQVVALSQGLHSATSALLTTTLH